MNRNHNRKQWLDIAKGIAIILMVIGHTSIPNIASNFIYAFHMPLFFIASGFTSNFKKHSPSSYMKHKFRIIILPFLIYSVIVSIMLHAIGQMNFIHLLSNGWEGYALWFIPVLFLASILAMLTSHVGNAPFRYGIMLCLFLSGYGLSYFNIQLPWTLSTVPYATFLILVGAELKHLQKYIEKTGHYWDIALLFIIVTAVSQFYRLDLAWNKITPILPLTIGAISGTLMIFRLSVWVGHHIKRFSTILQGIGRETYIVVAFSQVIIMYLIHFFAMPTLLKYVSLTVLLVLLKYAKDGINRLVKVKIL